MLKKNNFKAFKPIIFLLIFVTGCNKIQIDKSEVLDFDKLNINTYKDKVEFIKDNTQEQFYFDIPKPTSKRSKDCYYWKEKENDKIAYLTFQGSGEEGINTPQLTDAWSDDSKILIKFNSEIPPNKFQSNFFIDFYSMFTSENKPHNTDYYNIFYKIKGRKEIFGIKIRFIGFRDEPFMINSNNKNSKVLVPDEGDSAGRPKP